VPAGSKYYHIKATYVLYHKVYRDTALHDSPSSRGRANTNLNGPCPLIPPVFGRSPTRSIGPFALVPSMTTPGGKKEAGGGGVVRANLSYVTGSAGLRMTSSLVADVDDTEDKNEDNEADEAEEADEEDGEDSLIPAKLRASLLF